MQREIVATPHCRNLTVYIHGNINERNGKTFFLTVHDVGANSDTFADFVSCPSMAEARKKSVWLNVIVPGQDVDDDPIPPGKAFPTLDDMAKDLAVVLDTFKIRTMIGVGEGAGANVLLRFGIMFPNRSLGLILIDCSLSSPSLDEQLFQKLYDWKANSSKLWSKFVGKMFDNKKQPLVNKKMLNPSNVAKYLDAYMKRDDISAAAARELNVECLMVTGSLSPHNVSCQQSVRCMDKKRSTLLVIDDVVDVVYEASMNLTRALILFCKSCGVLTNVPLLGLEKEYRQAISGTPSEAQKSSNLSEAVRMYEEFVDF